MAFRSVEGGVAVVRCSIRHAASQRPCHLHHASSLRHAAQAADRQRAVYCDISLSIALPRFPSPATTRVCGLLPLHHCSHASPRYRIAIVSSILRVHLKEKVPGTCEIVEHDLIAHSSLSTPFQFQHVRKLGAGRKVPL